MRNNLTRTLIAAFAMTLTLAFFGATSACKSESGGVGIPFPRYPGTSYFPMGRQEVGDNELLIARLNSGDAYITVWQWYEQNLGAEWTIQKSDMGWMRWHNGNVDGVVPGRANFGKPKDPSQEAKIIVVQDGNPTTIFIAHCSPKGEGEE